MRQSTLKNGSLIFLSLLLLALSLLAKIVGTVWLSRYQHGDFKEYSYMNDDYPNEWPIARPPVLMASDTSLRFQLNTSDGAAEWSAIIPGGNALVRLGPHRQPYTISMFHQLRCLDILRTEMLGSGPGAPPTALARHCLNYVKQMVLCRGDTVLESFRYDTNEDPIDLLGTYECKNWGAVYDAVNENQRKYERSRLSREL